MAVIDWHGQRRKKRVGTKETAEHANILLEAKLAFGANVIPPRHPGGLPITLLWLPHLVR